MKFNKLSPFLLILCFLLVGCGNQNNKPSDAPSLVSSIPDENTNVPTFNSQITCSVVGCTNTVYKDGLCPDHYVEHAVSNHEPTPTAIPPTNMPMDRCTPTPTPRLDVTDVPTDNPDSLITSSPIPIQKQSVFSLFNESELNGVRVINQKLKQAFEEFDNDNKITRVEHCYNDSGWLFIFGTNNNGFYERTIRISRQDDSWYENIYDSNTKKRDFDNGTIHEYDGDTLISKTVYEYSENRLKKSLKTYDSNNILLADILFDSKENIKEVRGFVNNDFRVIYESSISLNETNSVWFVSGYVSSIQEYYPNGGFKKQIELYPELSTSEFDEKGNRIKISYYEWDGSLTHYINNEYNFLGQCVKRTTHEGNGQIQEVQNIEYYSSGKVVTIIFFTNGKEVRVQFAYYDEQGNFVSNEWMSYDEYMLKITPTPTNTPTNTPTCTNTPTVSPTPKPTMSPTPLPTDTPQPTSTPIPTTKPSDTPTPTPGFDLPYTITLPQFPYEVNTYGQGGELLMTVIFSKIELDYKDTSMYAVNNLDISPRYFGKITYLNDQYTISSINVGCGLKNEKGVYYYTALLSTSNTTFDLTNGNTDPNTGGYFDNKTLTFSNYCSSIFFMRPTLSLSASLGSRPEDDAIVYFDCWVNCSYRLK